MQTYSKRKQTQIKTVDCFYIKAARGEKCKEETLSQVNIGIKNCDLISKIKATFEKSSILRFDSLQRQQGQIFLYVP